MCNTLRTWTVHWVVGVGVVLATVASARPAAAQVSGQGYGFGAELDYLALFESMDEGFGLFSANGSYFFGSGARETKVRPFVTGGFTSLFDATGSAGLVNFGAGVHYWMRERLGLRLEFRDHVWAEGGSSLHYWGARVGVVFRK